jgi:hypothetical protein
VPGNTIVQWTGRRRAGVMLVAHRASMQSNRTRDRTRFQEFVYIA